MCPDAQISTQSVAQMSAPNLSPGGVAIGETPVKTIGRPNQYLQLRGEIWYYAQYF